MTPMSLRDQIRKLLQLHTHPDSRAEILACFDEMSGEPTQQQAARWCEEIRGFHQSLVAASKFEANELGNLHAIDEALTSNACERAALRIAGLHARNLELEVRMARAGDRAEAAADEVDALRDQLAYACHQLARIAGAIDETGKAAEALMTGWGEEHGRAGEDAARHVADEALDVMLRATDLAKASNRFGIARSRCIVEGLAFELAFEFTDALDALQTAAVASYEANLKRSRE